MAQKSVSFNTKSMPGGVRPSNIFTVDTNGDGLPDIIQDHAVNSGWSAILETAPGQFGSPMPVPSGMESASQLTLTIGDFNGDGIPDFAAPVYGSNTLQLRFGEGNGTFSDGTFAAFYNNGQFWTFDGNRIVATAVVTELPHNQSAPEGGRLNGNVLAASSPEVSTRTRSYSWDDPAVSVAAARWSRAERSPRKRGCVTQ